MDPLIIGIVTFNTQGVNYCFPEKEKSEIFSRCIKPDFVEEIANIFKENNVNLVVVGLQESRLSGDSLIKSFKEELKDFTLISNKYLVGLGKEGTLGFIQGIRLAIFTNRKINQVNSQTLRCPHQGLGKGSILSSFSYNGHRYAFVLSHLPFVPGGKDKVIYRNECMLKITKDFNLKDFNSVFLFGDLNYRIIDTKRNLSFQANKDQLRNYIKEETSPIKDYRELDPTFPPTCKLHTNRQKPCNKEEKKCYVEKRIPSWCDRIIYHSNEYTMNEYQVIDTPGTYPSDHMPVYAIFHPNPYKR